MIDRADPQAQDRAFDIARRDPPPGISRKAAAVVIAEVLEPIGDTCPECRISRFISKAARVLKKFLTPRPGFPKRGL
jgi:hypothetical protein